MAIPTDLNSSFTHSLLDSYEIEEDSPLPQITDESYVSKKDLLKSATIENLISQNEEMMTRQSVTLRRLATLEDLNQELQDENFRQKNQILNYADQVQVLKEKDSAWKNKVDEIEIEKEKLSQIAKQFEEAQSEIERHRKYHDKIKYQVKPYIQNLKNSRDEAQTEMEGLKNQIHLKDTQVKEMRSQMQELLRQSKNQIDDMQRQSQGLVEHFEGQIQSLKDDRAHFEQNFNDLKTKMTAMNQALEKKAELENRVIELERSRLELRGRLEAEIIRLQSKFNDSESARTRFEIENADLKTHIQDEHTTKLRHEEETLQLRRQMESLRFMWTQKNEETERQKKSLEALEKLNYSLSQKIEELRNSLRQNDQNQQQQQLNSEALRLVEPTVHPNSELTDLNFD
jgi:chromosome segregation ATPase